MQYVGLPEADLTQGLCCKGTHLHHLILAHMRHKVTALCETELLLQPPWEVLVAFVAARWTCILSSPMLQHSCLQHQLDAHERAVMRPM